MALFGKPGPQGPPGPAGPQGPQGEPGLDGDRGPAWEIPIGDVVISTTHEDPALRYGYGAWAEFESGEFSETSPTVWLYRRTA